jgi:di/tricarboxylate transporter
MEPLILSLILLAMLALFLKETFPPDVTALMALSLLIILSNMGLGLQFLTPEEGIAGFANTAVITVGAMFVISTGLMRTGAMGYIGDKIISLSGGDPKRVLILTMCTVAFFSSFVNNTPVVVLFLPILLRVCFRYNLSPSKYLIPLSYASVLGGTCTLIGTSTNILVSGLAASIGIKHPEYNLHPMGMFELAPVGVTMAILGLLMLALLAHRILPVRKTVTSTLFDVKQKTFMTELEIQSTSPCIGRTVGEAILSSYKDLNVLEVIRGERVIYPPVDKVNLQQGDILLTKGTANDIVKVLRDRSAVIASELGMDDVRMTERHFTLAEVVIMPTSEFVAKTISQVGFKRRYDVNVIAILRKGRHMHIKEQISEVPLAVGDTLLVQGGEDGIAKMRSAENVLLLEGIGETVFNPRKAPIALAIISCVVVGATLNIMPIMTLALFGALMTVVTNCITVKEAYKSLDASILVLIACTIALGTAMGNTGTAQLYADFVVSIAKPLGPVAVIGVIFLLTSFITEFISNNATAVLLTPVAIATGVGLGYQPMPFVMAVLFGASACYATPIGYQTNLFVYGPGGYRFVDYLKLGVPMNILTLAVGTTLIPMVWPLVPLAGR